MELGGLAGIGSRGRDGIRKCVSSNLKLSKATGHILSVHTDRYLVGLKYEFTHAPLCVLTHTDLREFVAEANPTFKCIKI